ncbi:MAG: D-alanine--D-alanine ligase, partial [Gemmatimonadota bacterium]|nr:D-alanine--D-alanine ligase [Gemmatimonadota bacterium]
MDPVLDQLEGALVAGGHTTRRLAVDAQVQPLINELTAESPDLVFNLAESFRGKSALESNVAALLN